jgi:hypothetical protein
MARSSQRGVAGSSFARSPYSGNSRYRRPYISPYRVRIVPGYGWAGPYFPGFPYGPGYEQGYDDSSDVPDNTDQGYDAGPQDQYPNPYPIQDQFQQGPPPQFQPGSEAARSAPASGEAVTLIFKDGRAPEQIHNYILTPTTLYVGDQRHQAIPTEQLDLAATVKANQDAGVDFQLPTAPR